MRRSCVARKDKAAIAIGAFGKTRTADLHPDARVPVAAVFVTIAEQPRSRGDNCFGRRLRFHRRFLASPARQVTTGQIVPDLP